MKITKSLAQKLIEESPSFRQFVLDSLFFEDIENIRSDIRRIVEFSSDKIRAIKNVRQYSNDYQEQYRLAYPHHSFANSDCVCLTDAKRLVESFNCF
jgi:hypothetical protein